MCTYVCTYVIQINIQRRAGIHTVCVRQKEKREREREREKERERKREREGDRDEERERVFAGFGGKVLHIEEEAGSHSV